MGGDIDNNIKMLWILLLQIDFYEVLLYIKFNVSPMTLSAIEELFCGKKNVKKSAIPCKCNLSRDACAFVVTQFSFLFNNTFFPSKFHFFLTFPAPFLPHAGRGITSTQRRDNGVGSWRVLNRPWHTATGYSEMLRYTNKIILAYSSMCRSR